jgi:hypothetical protein
MSASAHLAIVASAIYFVRLLPQPIKTQRTGKVEGVSWLGANTLIADGAWFAYGLTAHITSSLAGFHPGGGGFGLDRDAAPERGHRGQRGGRSGVVVHRAGSS